MISALDEIDSIVRCIEAGAEDYLPKPFDPVLLRARIDASLERSGCAIASRPSPSELQVEKSKSDALLLNILPATIVERMRQGEVAIADRFPEATILFSDLVGFTSLAGRSSPEPDHRHPEPAVLGFDRLAKRLGLEKIKTIGDAYMVAGGLPEAAARSCAWPSPTWRSACSRPCDDIGTQFGERARSPHRHPFRRRGRRHHRPAPIHLRRLGRHREYRKPPGIVRLPNRIQISEATYALRPRRFHCEPRGEIAIRGKGTMLTYFLGPRIR